MERWHLDLDQVRKNWERDSPLPTATAGKIAPTATGSATPKVTEKFCPGCGAELAPDVSSADMVAPTAAGSALPTGIAENMAPTATGSALFKGFDSPRAGLPSRFARVEAPRDPYPEAQALLVRLRALTHRQLAAHEPILTHFLDETAENLQRLAAKPGEGKSPPADKKKVRADLDRALGDLEDMVALWSGIGR